MIVNEDLEYNVTNTTPWNMIGNDKVILWVPIIVVLGITLLLICLVICGHKLRMHCCNLFKLNSGAENIPGIQMTLSLPDQSTTGAQPRAPDTPPPTYVSLERQFSYVSHISQDSSQLEVPPEYNYDTGYYNIDQDSNLPIFRPTTKQTHVNWPSPLSIPSLTEVLESGDNMSTMEGRGDGVGVKRISKRLKSQITGTSSLPKYLSRDEPKHRYIHRSSSLIEGDEINGEPILQKQPFYFKNMQTTTSTNTSTTSTTSTITSKATTTTLKATTETTSTTTTSTMAEDLPMTISSGVIYIHSDNKVTTTTTLPTSTPTTTTTSTITTTKTTTTTSTKTSPATATTSITSLPPMRTLSESPSTNSAAIPDVVMCVDPNDQHLANLQQHDDNVIVDLAIAYNNTRQLNNNNNNNALPIADTMNCDKNSNNNNNNNINNNNNNNNNNNDNLALRKEYNEFLLDDGDDDVKGGDGETMV